MAMARLDLAGREMDIEYAHEGVFERQLVRVARNAHGIERIFEVDLDDGERAALAKSADAVRDVVSVLTT